MTDRNATQAAIRAGYSKATARQIGSENLSKPAIAAEIEALDAAYLARIKDSFELDRGRLLRQVAMGAFGDIRALYDKDGQLIPPHKLSFEQACLIEAIKHTPVFAGTGADRHQVGCAVEYKLARRYPWVDMAMKHLGEYAKDNGQKGEALVGSLAELVAGMKRSTLPIVKEVAA